MNLNSVQESLKDLGEKLVGRLDSLFDKKNYNSEIEENIDVDEIITLEKIDWYNDVG